MLGVLTSSLGTSVNDSASSVPVDRVWVSMEDGGCDERKVDKP